MATQITYTFDVQVTGFIRTVAQMETALAAVPIDVQTLSAFWGLRVTSDVTSSPAANIARRTIIVAMGPSVVALATPNLDKSRTPSSIVNYTITQNGLNFIRPPVVSIADTAPGTGSGATAFAQLGVFGVGGLPTGVGYTAATTTVTAVGGELAPGGAQATFGTVTVLAGQITAVPIVTAGGPYNFPPTLVVADTSGGTGAVLTAQLGVSALVGQSGGQGYSNPAVTFTPWFKSIVPDAFPTAQAASVQSWMQDVIQRGIGVSVMPGVGVVA